jgi:hypothetical protein
LKVVAILLGLQQGDTKVAVSCVYGTVEQKFPITRTGAGLPDSHWNQEKEYTASTAGRLQQHFAAFPAYDTGTSEELW